VLYLHIGTHKTGTSALQTFMALRIEALKKKGVRYISAGMGAGRQHHAYAWSLRGDEGYSLDIWDAMRRELAEEHYPMDVLSSEAFWFSDPALVKEQVAGIDDVRVVIYLRRQDKYLQSLYKQTVVGGRKLDFDDWCGKFHFRGDYLSVIRQWAAVFGPRALILRPYERDGATVNSIADFFSVLGVDVEEELRARGEKMRNPSPRRELLDYIRALNHIGLEFNRDKFFWALVRRSDTYVRSADILDRAQSAAVMAGFAESNRILSEEFYRDPSAPLFPEPGDAPPPVIWQPGDKEYFGMTIDFLDVLIRAVADGEIKVKKPRKKEPEKAKIDTDM